MRCTSGWIMTGQRAAANYVPPPTHCGHLSAACHRQCLGLSGLEHANGVLFHSPDLKFDRSGRQLRCANCIDDPSSNRDGSPARRANKLDLTQRLDLSNPDNMPGSAGGAANDASMCGHRPTRREGDIRSPTFQIKAADVFCGPGLRGRLLFWRARGNPPRPVRRGRRSVVYSARSAVRPSVARPDCTRHLAKLSRWGRSWRMPSVILRVRASGRSSGSWPSASWVSPQISAYRRHRPPLPCNGRSPPTRSKAARS